ncbi:MAG: CcoQ/FixQ family Cbb3-type cytochrome c oxidase assembly chaperone [Porphyrobacter sp.]|nr:CcoQ/FixQ family Cbb3-type cytochrome c oxidase assembly chaperone [Porphyrobacter sp.]
MSLYDQLRHFADAHGLAVIFALYLVLCLWHFRPGGTRNVEAASISIFKDDDDVQ